MRTKLLMIATVLLISGASSLITQSTIAKKGTPFQAGYDHGCNDAKVTFSARYINQPGKGPSFHTQEFMNGYNAGFRTCNSAKASAAASNISGSSIPSNDTLSSMYKQGYKKGVEDSKLTAPTAGLTTDDIDCESPHNLSGQDSIQYCKGYEDGFIAENNALHK